MRLLRSILLLALLGSVAVAQSVRWQPAGGTLARGQVSDLVLIFDNCEPSGDIPLPNVPNLQFGTANRGQQSSTNIINGRVQSTRYVYFSYPARPLNDDPVVIPSFTVETDQGPATVAAVSFDVREATVGNTSIPVSSVAQSTLRVGQGQIWAGEVVPVDYTLSISGRFRANIAGEPVWEPAPLVAEEWAQPTGSTQGSGQDLRNLVSYSSRGYISKPGTYALPSIQQLVNIGVPTAGIFQSMRAEQYAITSESPQVLVRPLPQPAPADFSGAVGTFSLKSKVVPETATVGEPVTWTLSLEGTGNWPEISGLPQREASQSFRVVQPQANRKTVEGKLFEGSISEDVVLIPTQNGEFTLGPVTWAFFNPKSGRYETLTAPATVLKVEGSLAPTTPSAPARSESPSTSTPTAESGPQPIAATPAPDSPAAIPRDPLPGAGSAFSPLSRRPIFIAAVAIVALFPLLWLVLSWRHAVRHDAGRHARLARRKLTTVLNQLRTASADRPKRDRLLLTWQQSTAVLWRTPRAAPTTSLFNGEATWTNLWREADRALYGQDRELPADWVNRAENALGRKRAPGFPVFSVLALRNLFPVVVALLALANLNNPLSADDAVVAYANGKFADAETTWRQAVQAQPTDWIAHHNLALALAQQNRWDEAGAHAAVAFVQNPRNPSVRWHLTYTLHRSGYTPPVFGRFTDDLGWSEKFAQLASPSEWQLILLGGLLLGILSLSLVLGHAYGMKLKPWKPLAWLGGSIGIVAMILAVFGLQVYGLAANADAVITWRGTQLRSIPTDLNNEQQTSQLFPGSLARVEKSFLGWRQLAFPNGQTGWVRKDDVVPLWRDAK